MIFTTYILRCSDGSYYTGHTDNFDVRVNQHYVATDGYVAERRPFIVVWIGEFETRADALAFELKLKGWSRAKKEALIAGDWNLVSKLSKTSKNRRDGGFDELSPNEKKGAA
jgi:predicted GIY-YIG superfamily endonuclease